MLRSMLRSELRSLAPGAGSTASLAHWVRLLWNVTPAFVAFESDGAGPHIEAGTIHLPAAFDWAQRAAAAAHAAAHLAYSPRRFAAAGLGAIARALVALLEDARVEALAARELPGLARLWRPLHRASAQDGSGFEALMGRLARALGDPGYEDPHPGVRKGVLLFRGSGGVELLALRTSAEVRTAALRLGNDIGQMRLVFNPRTYRPQPSYRDDHRWMWEAEALPEPAAGASLDAGVTPQDDSAGTDVGEDITNHPEWDRLIARLRPDFCRVAERVAAARAPSTPSGGEPADPPGATHGRQLARIVRSLVARRRLSDRDDGVETLDPNAFADWCVGIRLRRPADLRIYRAAARRPLRCAVWLLVDQSASSAQGSAVPGVSLLELSTRAAAEIAAGLSCAGIDCAIASFASAGRHAVTVQLAKRFDEAPGALVRARLNTLRAGGSTRLGAALRHATLRLCARRAERRELILLSDAQAHDIDVHDHRYLMEDARRAVDAAARQGVRIRCLVVGADRDMPAARVFGSGAAVSLRTFDELPRVLRRLVR